ncbi:hypothetical protein Mgra_00004013 [Meloidogyne graminicola]|uniref:Uncharacterized protein n=1 Tax=Meloidogyne graminicola TaxID=189291 RepID=A0A8S9ZTM8_9BILA|nr:hypothetical protein Mgra_00004013 [Meloidogyne graminicola]
MNKLFLVLFVILIIVTLSIQYSMAEDSDIHMRQKRQWWGGGWRRPYWGGGWGGGWRRPYWGGWGWGR